MDIYQENKKGLSSLGLGSTPFCFGTNAKMIYYFLYLS